MSRRALPLVLAAQLLAAAVPSPESFFGHRMGADRTLIGWDKTVAYFQELDRSSERIRVEVLGRTVDGRPFLAATIAAPEVLRDLERYRRIQQRLADPRQTPPAEAEKLFVSGKTVVMITCSIHSTEVASTHTAVEFAHRMVTGNDAKTSAILSNVILLLVPSLNPDGVEIVRRWYERTLGTPYEGTSPPELYHRYVGHDNNRDWYIFSQPETRITVSKLHNVWHPQIVYDVHQMGPFGARMFVPPWIDPIEPNIDPILVQLCNMIGMGMAADLTAAGKKGVVVNASYDFWTPARHYQAYHAGLRILSESAGARLATPIQVRPEEIRGDGRGFDPRRASWNHLEPWPGGEWRLRDIIDYQLIAWESCLYQAALRREDLLRNFYRIGERAVGRNSPYAFVIPAAQPDPGSARRLLETLAFGQVEIERAVAEFTAGGRRYGEGAYVVRMQQPYSSFAKTLLERQVYPDLREYPGGPPKRPYDVTAHTLPLLMGVEVDTVDSQFEAPLQPANEFRFAPLGPQPAPGAYPAADIDSWKQVNRIWQEGGSVWRDRRTGDFYASLPPAREAVELPRPRIGLYRSFVPSIDEGWTRWLLEEFGFRYASVRNPDIAAGNLMSRWDTIVFPDQSPSTLETGYRKGAMPEEYTGGLDHRSVASLQAFLADGGTLIFLNDSTGFAVKRLGIDAINVLDGVARTEFYCPGSLLTVGLERHPLTYGLPQEITVWFQRSPAWEAGRPQGSTAVARYPRSGVLASGWLLGEQHLYERAALLEVPAGKGRVILFGMRPQYRAQSYQTFKLFFNALVRR